MRLVGLVDGQRVVRDEVGERVRDAHEQGVEALLREHLVEDVGEAAVRLDERRGLGTAPPGRAGATGQGALPRARTGLDCTCRRARLLARGRTPQHRCSAAVPSPDRGNRWRSRTMGSLAVADSAARRGADADLPRLREAVAGCRGCPLWRTRDADRVRRGRRRRRGHARRRAAGRPGGSARAPVRRPGRTRARRRARGSRDRPRRDVRDERGEALQVRGAGQAAHPREADVVGDDGLPPVARGASSPRPRGALVCLAGVRPSAQRCLGTQFRVTKTRPLGSR